jgi:hypothetical protein
MTSNHLEDNTEILPVLEDKASIIAVATAFDIVSPITNEEFETQLAQLGMYLLMGTPWRMPESRKLVSSLPVLKHIPLRCHAEDCKYAESCPIIQSMNESQLKEIRGTQCRVDRQFAIESFTALIRDLDIRPDQTIDLMGAANAVRWMVIRNRIDMQLAQEGVTIDSISTINQKTGEVYGEMKAHPLMKEAAQVDKMIDQALKSLVATRKDRLNMAINLGQEKQALKDLLSFGNLYQDEEEE